MVTPIQACFMALVLCWSYGAHRSPAKRLKPRRDCISRTRPKSSQDEPDIKWVDVSVPVGGRRLGGLSVPTDSVDGRRRRYGALATLTISEIEGTPSSRMNSM